MNVVGRNKKLKRRLLSENWIDDYYISKSNRTAERQQNITFGIFLNSLTRYINSILTTELQNNIIVNQLPNSQSPTPADNSQSEIDKISATAAKNRAAGRDAARADMAKNRPKAQTADNKQSEIDKISATAAKKRAAGRDAARADMAKNRPKAQTYGPRGIPGMGESLTFREFSTLLENAINQEQIPTVQNRIIDIINQYATKNNINLTNYKNAILSIVHNIAKTISEIKTSNINLPEKHYEPLAKIITIAAQQGKNTNSVTTTDKENNKQEPSTTTKAQEPSTTTKGQEPSTTTPNSDDTIQTVINALKRITSVSDTTSPVLRMTLNTPLKFLYDELEQKSPGLGKRIFDFAREN